jgi:DNA-binding ferritin-like protein
MKESQDIARAKETLETHQQRLDELENEFRAEIEELQGKIDPMTEDLETVILRPAKKDIYVQLVALTWMPHWQSADGSLTPAWA